MTVQAERQVTLTVAPDPPYSTFPVWIEHPDQPPTFTADPCFNPVCQQWYHTDRLGEVRTPIPNATGLSYEFPNPVTYEFLGAGYFAVEVFDEGHIPHAAYFEVHGAW